MKPNHRTLARNYGRIRAPFGRPVVLPPFGDLRQRASTPSRKQDDRGEHLVRHRNCGVRYLGVPYPCSRYYVYWTLEMCMLTSRYCW